MYWDRKERERGKKGRKKREIDELIIYSLII